MVQLAIMVGPPVQTSGVLARRLLHTSRATWQTGSAPPSKPSEQRASRSDEGAGPSRRPPTSAPAPSNDAIQEGNSVEKPSFTTSASTRYADEDKNPLPSLTSPLGVRTRPSSRKLSWTERRDQAFDYDRRMDKRKAIVKEATRGYFSDFHAMRSHGGKTWLAPSTLIKQERSLYFPMISGTCLKDKTDANTADMLSGKVSIVCIMTSVLSEQHVKSFYEAALDVYRKDSNFQLIQINLQENRLKAYLVSLFLSSLRSQVPAPLQRTYLLSHQALTTEREDLGLHNKHVGYTYLVGPDEKIRWAAGGFAEKEERQALVACAGVLLSRLADDKRRTQKGHR